MLVGSRRQFEQMCDAISISKIRPLISAVYDFEDAKKVCLMSGGISRPSTESLALAPLRRTRLSGISLSSER